MPPRASVTVEDAILAVETLITHFATNELPQYSSPIWSQMSKVLDGKWSAHSCYVNVREDRRKILTIARQNKGIDLPTRHPRPKIKQEMCDSDDNYTDIVELDEDDVDLDCYDLMLTKEQWEKLRRSVEYINSDYVLLKKKVWSDVLSLACFKNVNLPQASSSSSNDPDFASH